jgi:5'(3')-deoxyribonucleotidase
MSNSSCLSIGIDMDGVICNFIDKFLPIVKSELGLTLQEEDFNTCHTHDVIYPLLDPKQQEEFKDSHKLYNLLCPPGFFKTLEPYDGAIEAVHNIAKYNKYVCIVTKPLEWDKCPGEKKWWIDKYLGDLKLPVFFTNKMENKTWIHTDVIIDDDVRVIKSLSYSTGLVVKRPWNKSYIDTEGCFYINELSEAPATLRDIEKYLLSY